MVSGFLGKEVPVYRLRVRISCYPLTTGGAFWAVATRRVAVHSTTLRSVAIKKAKSFVTWLFSFTDKRTSCWLSQKSLERPGAREFGCTIVDPSSNLEPIGMFVVSNRMSGWINGWMCSFITFNAADLR